MGRPRKRPHVEIQDPEPEPEPEKEKQKDERPVAIAIPELDFDPTIGMDLDLSFLDVNNTDINFLDLLDPNFQFTGDFQFTSAPSVEVLPPPTLPQVPKDAYPISGVAWGLGAGFGPIDFDVMSPPPPEPTQQLTLEEINQILAEAANTEAVPELSPPRSGSPSTATGGSPNSNNTDLSPPSPTAQPTAPSPEYPAAPCGCSTNLYLAIDSLQKLPAAVAPAMHVVRTAAKVAYNTVICPVCGGPPTESHAQQPSMLTFQNGMMLMALLPSISNAYVRILDMVDAETNKALDEGRKLVFSLNDFGGFWGGLALPQMACGATASLQYSLMEPRTWRLTVRALLKVDVYGVNDMWPPCGGAPVTHFGLKDIISKMEERSHRRHAEMDALIAAGKIEPRPSCGGYPELSKDKPNCMHIIDVAKRSMNHLVIP